MSPGDPLFDFALALRMSIGGVDVAERRVASVRRLAQSENDDAENCIWVRQARPLSPMTLQKGWLAARGRWLAGPRQRAAASLVFKPANTSQAAGTSTSRYVSSAPYRPCGP